MLCWPARSPSSASSRLPGGLRKKSRLLAESSSCSFRSAAALILRKGRGLLPSKRAWVFLQLNDLIIQKLYNGYRITSSVIVGLPYKLVIVAEALPLNSQLDFSRREEHAERACAYIPSARVYDPARRVGRCVFHSSMILLKINFRIRFYKHTSRL